MFKKFYYFLVTICFLCFISGCTSSDEPEPGNQKELSEIMEVYDNYQGRLKSQLGDIISMLEGNGSRSDVTPMSGEEFINYLISIPRTELDSLYLKYCTPEAEIMFDKRQELVNQILSANATPDEICYIYNFADEYYSTGGHNLPFVEKEVENQTPFIRNCMIRFAVCADEFVGNPSRGIEECDVALHTAIFRTVLESAVGDEVTIDLSGMPPAAMMSALLDLGLDAIAAMKIAYDYDECRRMHGVIVM